uniref:Uncharacterized protein n=1 Tax=Arundo donax TaxID=35708 RepID=A0A0A9F3Q6_ARUDO
MRMQKPIALYSVLQYESCTASWMGALH